MSSNIEHTVTEKDFPHIEHLVYWIECREKARKLRERSVPMSREGCGSSIVDNYRFCNVRREDDEVTKYVNWWLTPAVDDRQWSEGRGNFMANVLMARLFNNPETLENIGYQHEWSPEDVKTTCRDMQKAGARVFNPAYIVSTNGRKMDKVEYVVDHVLDGMFKNNMGLHHPDLGDIYSSLIRRNGVGSFMAAQVIADLKMFEPWASSPDYWKFCAPGPGSMRGLNRLRGLDANAQKYNLKAFQFYINPLRGILKVRTGLELCAQNTQNCLCEFDKYMRAKTGEGRPKQKYRRV